MKSVLTFIGIALVVIIVLWLVFVGVPVSKGTSTVTLKEYPSVDGHTIAVKFNSIDVFSIPFVKWKSEFIAYKGPLRNGTKYAVIDSKLQNKIEQDHGRFRDHLSWGYKYGWIIGVICLLLFIGASILVLIISFYIAIELG